MKYVPIANVIAQSV